MIDTLGSERWGAVMTRIRGRDIALESAVRPIAHRMVRRFSLHGKGPLETLVLPFRLGYYRLLHPDTSDSGLNTSLRSRGEFSPARSFEAHAILTVTVRAAHRLGYPAGVAGPS